jgi:hypothetical protein
VPADPRLALLQALLGQAARKPRTLADHLRPDMEEGYRRMALQSTARLQGYGDEDQPDYAEDDPRFAERMMTPNVPRPRYVPTAPRDATMYDDSRAQRAIYDHPQQAAPEDDPDFENDPSPLAALLRRLLIG